MTRRQSNNRPLPPNIYDISHVNSPGTFNLMRKERKEITHFNLRDVTNCSKITFHLLNNSGRNHVFFISHRTAHFYSFSPIARNGQLCVTTSLVSASLAFLPLIPPFLFLFSPLSPLISLSLSHSHTLPPTHNSTALC